MKNSHSFHSVLLFIAALFAAVQSNGQGTCQNPMPMDVYAFPDQQMGVTFTTVGVANDNAGSGAPYCDTSVGTGGQYWYTMNLGNVDPVQVTLHTNHPATNFDTKIHVYTGSCGWLTCVAGDDDAGDGNNSLVTFTANPGTQYRVRVGGFNVAEGITALRMDAGEPGCTDYNAANYDYWANFNDGTCCYTANISLPANAGQFASVALFMNNQLAAQATPGQTTTVCEEITCGNYVLMQGVPVGMVVTVLLHGGYQFITSTTGSSETVVLESSICGCLDPNAVNYNPTATMHNGTCYYTSNTTCATATLMEPNLSYAVDTENVPATSIPNAACNMLNGQQIAWYKFVHQAGITRLSVNSWNFDTAFGIFTSCGGDELICVDDTYMSTSNGGSAISVNPFVTYECGSELVVGQTYYVAVTRLGGEGYFHLVYDHYDVPGCVDSAALNFNACASTDDGSCITDVAPVCMGDFNTDNIINFSDLTSFLSIYGSVCN